MYPGAYELITLSLYLHTDMAQAVQIKEDNTHLKKNL